MLIVILMGATGYLLRWDIKAFALTDLIVSNFSDIPLLGQAVVVAMLGGSDLETVPLYGGYAYHVWIIPCFLAQRLLFTCLLPGDRDYRFCGFLGSPRQRLVVQQLGVENQYSGALNQETSNEKHSSRYRF